MSSTTNTPEHTVPAYKLPEHAAAEAAEAAQSPEAAETAEEPAEAKAREGWITTKARRGAADRGQRCQAASVLTARFGALANA